MLSTSPFKQSVFPNPHNTLETKMTFGSRENAKSLKRKFNQLSEDNNSPQRRLQSEIDALVAKEMNELSREQREKVLHDVHGVSDFPDENPIEIMRKLAELESEIQLITCKSAYQKALTISEDYVRNRSFRLKFLRADCFDASRAARRLVSFFEQKLKIFGISKLVKDITLDDLDAGDLAVVNNGHMQFLPQRDMSGRLIFCNIQSQERFAKRLNLLRAIFYMLMAESENEDIQRSGVVGIVYNFSLLGDEIDTSTILSSVELRNSLPLRFVSMHYCYNHPSFTDYINCERSAFDKQTRTRCRVHQVSATNFHSELVSYGITSRSLPASLIGGLKPNSHQEWIKGRCRKEGHSQTAKPKLSTSPKPAAVIECFDAPISLIQPNTESKSLPNLIETVESSSDSDSSSSPPAKRRSIVTPTPRDVLFGRGKVKEHPGNVRLHQLIDKRRSRYEVAEKWEKTVIAEEIVAILKEASGRFLRPCVTGEGWLEVDKEIAREKVSHTFRSRRPKMPTKRRKVAGSKRRPTSTTGILFVNGSF